MGTESTRLRFAQRLQSQRRSRSSSGTRSAFQFGETPLPGILSRPQRVSHRGGRVLICGSPECHSRSGRWTAKATRRSAGMSKKLQKRGWKQLLLATSTAATCASVLYCIVTCDYYYSRLIYYSVY